MFRFKDNSRYLFLVLAVIQVIEGYCMVTPHFTQQSSVMIDTMTQQMIPRGKDLLSGNTTEANCVIIIIITNFDNCWSKWSGKKLIVMQELRNNKKIGLEIFIVVNLDKNTYLCDLNLQILHKHDSIVSHF